MKRFMSVASFCNQSHNLELLGYSEAEIEELIQNGDLRGRMDPKTGGMMIESSETIGFLPEQLISPSHNPLL